MFALPIAQALGFDLWLISSNGAVTKSTTGEHLHTELLPAATARKLIAGMEEFRGNAVLTFDRDGKGSLVVERTDELHGSISRWMEKNAPFIRRVEPMEQALVTDPVQVMFCGPVERMRAAGLMVWAAFLLGYDHETPASIRETVDWALSKKFAFSAFNVLTPYPGTAFYERMRAEGRLRYGGRWWLHDDYRFGDVAFDPRHMAAEELSALGLEARLRHASPWQILRRATDRKTNSKDLWSLATYLAYNPLFRGEMLKKHGMTLGYRGYERA